MVSLRYSIIVFAVVTLGGFNGCDGKKDDPVSKRSSVKVQLPEKPSLKEPQYKRVHGDGMLTVEGLLRERDAHLNREVSVRGKVETLKLCDEVQEEPSKKASSVLKNTKKSASSRKAKKAEVVLEPEVSWKCKPQPFALLIDEQGSTRHKLRVGGTMGSRLAHLKVGETVELKGTFQVVTPNKKYMDQQGLLVLKDVQPPPGIQPAE